MSNTLCLFLLTTLLSTGYALRCYSCDSSRNSCSDSNVDRVGVETCGRSTANYQSSCIKRVFRDRNTGSQNVTRQCVLTPTSEADRQDYHCRSNQNMDMYQCRVCDDDLCNGIDTSYQPNQTPLAPFPNENSGDLKCYQCESTIDPYCDEQGSDRMSTITCSRYQSSAYKQGCLKKAVRNAYTGALKVTRQCIFAPMNSQPGYSPTECPDTAGGSSVMECNVCFSNYCNGPQQSGGYTPRPSTLYPSLPTVPSYTTPWRPDYQRPGSDYRPGTDYNRPGSDYRPGMDYRPETDYRSGTDYQRPIPPAQGGALRCYSCDSGLDPSCNDYQSSDRIPYVTCGRSVSPMLKAACVKKSFRNSMKGTHNITRQCIFTSIHNQPGFNQEDCQSSRYMEVTECHVCDTDLCNGPSSSGRPQTYPQQPYPSQYPSQSPNTRPDQYGSIMCYTCRNDTSRQCNSFWNESEINKEPCQSTDPSYRAACGIHIIRDKYNREVIGERICLATGRECNPSDQRYETIHCSTCNDSLCNKSPFNTVS